MSQLDTAGVVWPLMVVIVPTDQYYGMPICEVSLDTMGIPEEHGVS